MVLSTFRVRILVFAVAVPALSWLIGSGRSWSSGEDNDRIETAFKNGKSDYREYDQCMNREKPDPAKAKTHLESALKHFQTAEQLATGRPETLEKGAEAHCWVAEIQLRLDRPKDALTTLQPFQKDSLLRSRSQGRSLYLQGAAHFTLGDYVAAGRSLNRLAPFKDPTFGLHARYLLGRVHHLSEERPEAAVHYEAVLTEFDKQRAAAEEALKRPEKIQGEAQKEHLRAIVEQPPPDFVSRTAFCLGVLYCEQGRYPDALPFLARCLESNPSRPISECRWILGMAQVQSAQYAEAVATLQPVAKKDSSHRARALLWLGKAYRGLAGTKETEGHDEHNAAARKTLDEGLEVCRRTPQKGPQMERVEGETLLELADLQQSAEQYDESADRLRKLIDGNHLPRREEEFLLRRVQLLHVAGDYAQSDKACADFLKRFPKSTLLPDVMMRHAENGHFLALSAKTDAERKQFHEQATQRYLEVARFRDYELHSWSLLGPASSHYRKQEYEKAAEILEKIPVSDRRGPLASASYLLADAWIRTTPADADDALTAGKIRNRLMSAVETLVGYAEEIPENPLAAHARVRIAFCKQRLAVLQTQPDEQSKLRESSREQVEKILLDFPLDELQPHAYLERTRFLGDDPNAAVVKLRRFTQEPLSKSSIAPLAMLRLVSILQSLDQHRETARLLASCRQDHEKNLLKDPSRSNWVPHLRFRHALSLRALGKSGEARVLLEQTLKEFPADPLFSEVQLRWGQCRIEEGQQQIAAAQEQLGNAELTPAQKERWTKAVAAGWNMLRDTADLFEKQAEKLHEQSGATEMGAVLLQEAAWTHRLLAQPMIDEAWEALRHELHKKAQEEAARNTPKGQPVAEVPVPEVPFSRVPLQDEEKQQRRLLQKVIDRYPESIPSHYAALELSETYAQKAEYAPAWKILKDALDREPPQELTERMRLRGAQYHIEAKDEKSALKQLQILAARKDSPYAGQAHLLLGELAIASERWEESLKHLVLFRDVEAYQGQQGLTDRGLFNLGLVRAKQEEWDEARAAFALVVSGFGESPLCNGARCGIGWTYWKQKRYLDAEQTLIEVKEETPTEIGIRSQLLSALCKMQRNQHVEASEVLSSLSEPTIPQEMKAFVILQRAHLLALKGQKTESEQLWQRVLKEFPSTPWSKSADERLRGVKNPPLVHTLPEAQRLLTPPFPGVTKYEPEGRQYSNQPSYEDTTLPLSFAYEMTYLPPERTSKVPLLTLTIPDPFEHREAVRGVIPPVEKLPANGEW